MPERIIGFTCGAFDLLHAGHVHLLNECKEQCDLLYVGLHTDPTIDRPDTKNKPIQSTFERYYQLQAVDSVDAIIPYDTENDLCNILATMDINIRFLGSDYLGKSITGSDVCEERGIQIAFIPRLHTFSSTELRQRILSDALYREQQR